MEDIIWVYWKDPESHQRFKVGQISKNGNFTFEYVPNLKEMEEKGFKPFFPFLNSDEKYQSKELFPTFTSRLADRKRKDINVILDKYGLKEYDSFELLKKSGGRLPIDTLEFIEPIDLSHPSIRREFYIAGVSHGELCDGVNCKNICSLKLLDRLDLVPEPTNQFDKYAIELCKNEIKIGYVPIYYSEAVYQALKNRGEVECRIIELNIFERKSLEDIFNCQECIKAVILIK